MNHSEGRNPSNCNDNKKTDSKARALKKSSRQEGFSIINKKQIAYNR